MIHWLNNGREKRRRMKKKRKKKERKKRSGLCGVFLTENYFGDTRERFDAQ